LTTDGTELRHLKKAAIARMDFDRSDAIQRILASLGQESSSDVIAHYSQRLCDTLTDALAAQIRIWRASGAGLRPPNSLSTPMPTTFTPLSKSVTSRS
jgi:hypothetical protein